MSIADDVSQMTNQPIPKEWQPYAEENGITGTGAALLPRPWNTTTDLLTGAGFDPREWRIDGPINSRRWMRYDQTWLYYYKFNVVAGESPEDVKTHVDELEKVIRRRRRAPSIETGGHDAWAYWASDWQIGKREGDNGTPQTVDRVLESFDLAEAQIKSLRRAGRKMPTGVLFGLGDIVEGCTGFYPGQTFMVDANRREQGRIARELLTHGIDRLLPLFESLVVGCVGGNHGENRTPKGDRLTDVSDNDDVAVFEGVREAFDRAGEDRIEWVIPEGDLSMALSLGGTEVAVTHGHLFKGGLADLSAQRGAVDWWKGQDFGFQEVRGTRVLVSAHFHHYSCNTFGGRTAFQTPAMDPGSEWVVNRIGEEAPAAVLTMRLDGDEPLGWSDVALLSPRSPR
jgi:hypothetical protein